MAIDQPNEPTHIYELNWRGEVCSYPIVHRTTKTVVVRSGYDGRNRRVSLHNANFSVEALWDRVLDEADREVMLAHARWLGAKARRQERYDRAPSSVREARGDQSPAAGRESDAERGREAVPAPQIQKDVR